jgi:sterol desaturase/sphingolipid hydroxylase (fatty acid hydroxylase superfamily)
MLFPQPILQAIYPVFLAMILLEIGLLQRYRKSAFNWQESLTSFGIAIGHRLSNALFGGFTIATYTIVYEHRLFTISLDQGWTIVALFLGIEFFYYWHHRAAHEIRWIWATHAVHHSARHLNLSAAYRLGWTGWLSGNFLFFLPLCWLGFHPITVAVGLAINLMYQFWIHTELIPKLGVLEWFLNTPSHHRVHHASNTDYINRNYGGVLIIFDRWFGTLAAERSDHRPIYGLTHPIYSHNPITIAFSEWRRLWQDLRTAQTWPERCRIIGGRPT